MAKKQKHKKQVQEEIATEASQQQQRIKLKRQIVAMKRLPKDFRDITLGTDWETFAAITGRREEMDAWYHGPVVYFGKLNESEKMILGSPNKLIHYDCCFDDDWQHLINQANIVDKASWIYLPDEESTVVDAFNVLFSRFSSNIRAKGQLISEHTGKPVGVVH